MLKIVPFQYSETQSLNLYFNYDNLFDFVIPDNVQGSLLLCILKLLMEVLGGPYMKPEIKLRSAAYKASISPPLLSSSFIFLF